jgi:hypothetical protein
MKERYKGRKDYEEGVSSYWKTLRIDEVTGK